MASSYTANYGLCQWAPENAFLREEFNQDNAKIDAALKETEERAAERAQAAEAKADRALSGLQDQSYNIYNLILQNDYEGKYTGYKKALFFDGFTDESNVAEKSSGTLYLCLEDSVLRIQNRLFEITEDAPSSVHFCTECALIGQGLEEQVETFLAAHPDTVLVIIDTLQMVRPARDATYANDYRDLSALKRIADARGIAILLIHHLRKESADDVFNRISGTTAISGAVDSSFTLVEERRGSGRAKLSCIGRDIEYRELTLERNGENVWELVSDSRTQPELLGDRIIYLLSELMRDRTEFIGTPTELSERIDPVGVERMSPKKVSRQILQNLDALRKIGISAVVRRSNGRRLIELQRAGSDDTQGVPAVDPVDPAGALCGDLRAVSGGSE